MAGSSRTPLSQLCQQKSAPRGTVTTDLTLQVESHKDATVDVAPTRALLADVPCVLTACVGANHTHHFRTRQHTIVEERDYRAYSPPDVLISLHTSSHLTYTHHPGLSVSHLPAAPCPVNGGRPRSWLTKPPCEEL